MTTFAEPTISVINGLKYARQRVNRALQWSPKAALNLTKSGRRRELDAAGIMVNGG